MQEQSLRRTFVSIAAEVGLDEKTIRNIFHDYVAELEKTHVFQTPRWLGIDELLLVRKQRCILTNVRAGTIIGLLPARTSATVTRFLSEMPDRQQIELVCMVISDDGVPSFLASGDAGCVARAQGFPILKSSSVKWRFYAGPHLFEEVFRYLSGVGEGL